MGYQRLKIKNEGFTFIEMIVTLLIVVILSIGSIALFLSLTSRYRLTTAAEQLFATLQYARTEAIKRNSLIYVSFSTGDNWCYGVNVASNCDCTIANNCTLGATAASATQVLSLSTTGLTNNAVYFDGAQGMANASGSVTFTLYGQSSLIKISISRLGNLQMCATGLTGYTGC